MSDQETEFWNTWNAEYRETGQTEVSQRQARIVVDWMRDTHGLRILDAGCGTGWMVERLIVHGDVVGIDIADEVIERARQRVPSARFFVGDIMSVDVGRDFDVIVSLEVLSHVADQPAFMRHLASLLVPGGRLLMATQNRPVLERLNRIGAPAPGQRRRWVDRRELRSLAEGAGFHVEQMFVVTPQSNHRVFRRVAWLARIARATPLLERLGFGWTIMMDARAPAA